MRTRPSRSLRLMSDGWTLSDEFVHGDLVEKARPKLGTGTRFKKLTGQLSARGARDPKALAAWIGRKKYGKKKLSQLSAKKRKRKKLSKEFVWADQMNDWDE